MTVQSVFPALEQLLPRVQKPVQYVGGELNAVVKPWDDTIVPRLMAAGADLKRVIRLTPPPILPDDLDKLGLLIDERDVALVILDPLLSRLNPKLNTHVDGEVRQGLEPLKAWAETRKIAILGLVHVNKNTMGDVMTSFTGSRAFAAVVRSALVLMADPDDPARRLLALVKTNIGKLEQPTLAFKIEGTTFEGNINTAKLVWLDDDPRSPSEIWEQQKAAARSTSSSGPTKVDGAADWLVEYLRAYGGTAPVKNILKAGERNGYSRVCLNRAEDTLQLDHPQRGVWGLPTATSADVSPSPPDTKDTNDTSPAGAPPPNSVPVHTEGAEEEVNDRVF